MTDSMLGGVTGARDWVIMKNTVGKITTVGTVPKTINLKSVRTRNRRTANISVSTALLQMEKMSMAIRLSGQNVPHTKISRPK